MHQTAEEAQSPPDRCSDEFLGVGTQTSLHWLGKRVSRCLLMPVLLGDVCLMFPGPAENHTGMRPLATPAARPHHVWLRALHQVPRNG